MDLQAGLADIEGVIDRARAEGTHFPGLGDDLLGSLETALEELRVADEEVQAQQRLSRWQHERLLAALPVAVVVTDAHGRTRSFNAAAASLLQLPDDRMLGKPLQSFVPLAERTRLRRALSEAISTSTDVRLHTSLTPRSSAVVEAEIVCLVTRDAASGVVELTWLLMPTAPPRLDDQERGDLSTHALLELTTLPLRAGDTTDLLHQVAKICGEALGPDTLVTVTVGAPEEPDVLASNTAEAQHLDGAQIVGSQGPCQQAWEQRTTVVSEDMTDDARWPRLSQLLAGTPATAAVAVPVVMGEEVLGVINVYHPSGEAFAHLRKIAELLAPVIGAILHEIELKRSLAELAEQLRTAMAFRAPIEQAKGMVMALRGCTEEEAFKVLVEESNRRNVKLRTVATEMVGQGNRATR